MKPIPPLLMLAEGVRPRPRRAARPAPKEIELHMAVAGFLRQHVKPEWKWGHYPAGEHRDVRTASKLKAMGVQRGWPDILLISPKGLLHGLELKRQGEDLTDDQVAFQTWAIAHGVPHGVARSIDEVLTIFGHWGCLRVSGQLAQKRGGAA